MDSMENMINVKPYEWECADKIFSALFCNMEHSTELGLTEIPAASYQLVISALEFIEWELCGDEKNTIKKAVRIVEGLRDKQNIRELRRQKEATE